MFHFYHDDDLQWVLNGGPWSFDGALLVFDAIKKGEDPLMVPLFELQFWIQIHGLPTGFIMSEVVGKQLGSFFGSFQLYDPNNNTSIWNLLDSIKRFAKNMALSLLYSASMKGWETSVLCVDCLLTQKGSIGTN